MEVKELLEAKKIHYLPKGNDYLVRCLNPEHEDRHPSMRIDQITGVFNCFSCHYKGNLFTLFEETVNILQVKRKNLKKLIDRKRSDSIGMKFPNDMTPYEEGWRDIQPATYKKFEAFQSIHPDFVGRIVFPIRNITGKITAFVGRHTSAGLPKYLVHPRSAKLPLYPSVKPKQGSVILTEGIYDVINLHDKGLVNAVCCFGTQNINVDKLQILKMQGVREIVIFFDGDEPGQKAAEKVKELCDKAELLHRSVYLKGSDPGDLTRKQVNRLERKLYD